MELGQRDGYWQICGGIGRVAAHRLPAIYQWKEHVEDVALMSYGPSLVQLWRQAGIIAAKLLNGAKLPICPVEPRKFELVVNTPKAPSLDKSSTIMVGQPATSRHVRFPVAIGGKTDVTRTCQAATCLMKRISAYTNYRVNDKHHVEWRPMRIDPKSCGAFDLSLPHGSSWPTMWNESGAGDL